MSVLNELPNEPVTVSFEVPTHRKLNTYYLRAITIRFVPESFWQKVSWTRSLPHDVIERLRVAAVLYYLTVRFAQIRRDSPIHQFKLEKVGAHSRA